MRLRAQTAKFEAMSLLPPMVVRALTSMKLDEVSLASLDTLLCWALELEGTLAMTGLAKVGEVLEALDRQQLEPGETEDERQKIRAMIVKRLLE